MAVEGAAEYESDERHLEGTVIPLVATATHRKARYQGSRGKTPISEIVIHDTGSGTRQFSKTEAYLAHPKDGRGVSIHYLIGREIGEFVAMVPEDRRANHAIPRNSKSIGIELWRHKTYKGDFSPWQYCVLSQLVYDIMRRRNVLATNVVGHGEFNHNKRGEPHGFDWNRFWYELMKINEEAKAIRREFNVL